MHLNASQDKVASFKPQHLNYGVNTNEGEGGCPIPSCWFREGEISHLLEVDGGKQHRT